MGSTRKTKAGGGKRFVLFTGLIAAGAGAFALLRRKQNIEDPWATPDGSIPAYTPPTTGRASTVDDAPATEDPVAAPDTFEDESFEDESFEDESFEPQAAEAPETADSEPEAEAEAEPELPAGAAAVQPDGSQPEGHPVKGNLKTGLFHEPGGKWFDGEKADLWFVDEEAAAAAGLTKAGTNKAADADDVWAKAKDWADGDTN